MVLFPLLAMLLLQQPAEGQVPSANVSPLGEPLAGADYLLIAEAARRPEMRGVDLSCYRIFVHGVYGDRRVSFVEARKRVIERETDAGTEITFLGPDPKCPSISFVMDADGNVARVIHSRD